MISLVIVIYYWLLCFFESSLLYILRDLKILLVFDIKSVVKNSATWSKLEIEKVFIEVFCSIFLTFSDILENNIREMVTYDINMKILY